MKTTTVEYVNETVEDAVNKLAVAVTVDVTFDTVLLVGVPLITAFAPGKLLEFVVKVNPGGRFSPLKEAVPAVSG